MNLNFKTSSLWTLAGVFLLVSALVSSAFLRSSNEATYPLLRRCIKHMETIDEALRRYAVEKRDFPRDSEGHFSPGLLLCDANEKGVGCLQRNESMCSLHSSDDNCQWCGFVWCKDASPDQVEEFLKPIPNDFAWQPSTWVVMCHDENSIHKSRKFRGVLVLLSSGIVVRYAEKTNEYRKWVSECFRNGDSSLPDFIVRVLKDPAINLENRIK